MGLGIMVQFSGIGDKPELHADPVRKEQLNLASKFYGLTQYDQVLLQRKKYGHTNLLAFSPARNILGLNMQPRGYRRAVLKELEEIKVTKGVQSVNNLKLFNGLKGTATLAVMWGTTFWLVQYSEIDNPGTLPDMLGSYTFAILVASTVYAAPLFLFCSAFLQTFSFMQRPEHLRFKASKIIKFYLWNLLKLWPINAVSLLIQVVLMSKMMGSGPIWQNYDKAIEPCMTYWWTNLLWVNNLYPRAMDDKCLPWTWFIPCYVQLTLILPIFLFLAHKFKENGACILSALPILVISFNLMFGYF